MSLTKLLKAPIKLFKKEVISFVIIRRYDLGKPYNPLIILLYGAWLFIPELHFKAINERLRYITVRPSASISVLRQKVWFLLDLPDYCEEIIILKTTNDVEIPLTELRRGNDPQHPYILEVWSPQNHESATTVFNMITMGKESTNKSNISSDSIFEEKIDGPEKYCGGSVALSTASTNETRAINKLRNSNNLNYTDFIKPELPNKVSKSSIFRINGRKSQDNFTNLLLKIQSDLSTVSNKLNMLENKISL